MELGEIVRYLAWTVLASSMFVAGLYLKPGQLVEAAKQYRLLARAIIANALVIPLVGLALYFIIPMPESIGTAFLLMTFSFGIPMAANFTKSMRADVPFVTVLVFALAVVTSITMPVLMYIFLPEKFSISKSIIAVILFITLFQLVPLLIGLVLGDSKTIKGRLLRPLALVTTVLAIGLIGLVVVFGLAAAALVGFWPVLAMFTLTMTSLGVGWLFGGPSLINRKVLAVNTTLRNFPICLLMATSIFANTPMAVGVAVFSAMMILVVLAFSRLISRYQAPEEFQDADVKSGKKHVSGVQ